MCGICGIWSPESGAAMDRVAGAVEAMSDTLRHRGPDAAGRWTDRGAGIALAHRRLAIIDLSPLGGQPMMGPSGNTHVVFNGEIYNYVELRDVLAADGVRFRSASDTEVILALYEKYGDACVERLRGMFAFALWDASRRRLLIARDRVGKKPLYYASRRGQLVFASELKALRRVLGEELHVDAAAVTRFLSFGFISGPGTIYRDVFQLPPASMLVARAPDRYEVRTYWSPYAEGQGGRSRTPTPEQIEQALGEAVRIRLRADVPVASFLSGGVDSGLITAMAAQQGGALSTFTVGFDDATLDERPLARLVAARYATDHHELSIAPDVERLVPVIARAYDQPFADASAVPSYSIAEAVSQRGFKVVLNGDGGDELFGGYRRALAAAWLSAAYRIAGAGGVGAVARAALRLLPVETSHRSRYGFLRRFVRAAAADDMQRLLIWSTDSFTADERRDLGLAPYDEAADPEGLASYVSPSAGNRSPAAMMRELELRWSLPYALLVKMDIATMAHGLEARSPLLDQELVSMMAAAEGPLVSGFTTKPLLRAVARKYLPAAVVNAPKRGFEPPILQWVTGEIRALRDDLLLSRDGLVPTVARRADLERFLRHPAQGDPHRWAYQVWILMSLAAWDRFVNHEPEHSGAAPEPRPAFA